MFTEGPCVKNLVPGVSLWGGAMDLGKVEFSRKSLYHWGHALEGNFGTSASF